MLRKILVLVIALLCITPACKGPAGPPLRPEKRDGGVRATTTVVDAETGSSSASRRTTSSAAGNGGASALGARKSPSQCANAVRHEPIGRPEESDSFEAAEPDDARVLATGRYAGEPWKLFLGGSTRDGGPVLTFVDEFGAFKTDPTASPLSATSGVFGSNSFATIGAATQNSACVVATTTRGDTFATAELYGDPDYPDRLFYVVLAGCDVKLARVQSFDSEGRATGTKTSSAAC